MPILAGEHAAKDLFKAAGGFPTLHVYIREAHPMDGFNAAPNGTGPLSLARTQNKHQTIEDRRQSAQEALGFIPAARSGSRTQSCLWMACTTRSV